MKFKGIPIVEAAKLSIGSSDLRVAELFIDEDICFCEFIYGNSLCKFSYRHEIKSVSLHCNSEKHQIIRNIFDIVEILDKHSFSMLLTEF